jgi:serine/threonine protein kinase
VVSVKGKGWGCEYARKAYHVKSSKKDFGKKINFSLLHTSPYLVSGVEWMENEGQTYLVMEYCSHLSLLHYIWSVLKKGETFSSDVSLHHFFSEFYLYYLFVYYFILF